MSRMHRWMMVCAFLMAVGGMCYAQDNKKLQIYFIDVEGGQATLFVAPGGESLLIDTGWPGSNGRDAQRIMDAAKKAGIQKIDNVLITHFHVDHVGGVPQLTEKIPVGTFYDHGLNHETDDSATLKGFDAYQKVLAAGKYRHDTPSPGDILPIKGMRVQVVSADGNLIESPFPGGGEKNAYCGQSEVRPTDKTENSRSLGVLITFGKLRILDLGDLTWDKEMQLMCPINRIGHVNILVVSHHGLYQSSSPALVDAIHPQVAVMDNGAKKGGSKATLETFKKVPGLETLWQLHYSEEGGAENTSDAYIANPQGQDQGYGLELRLANDGSFSVLNPRTGASKQYAAK